MLLRNLKLSHKLTLNLVLPLLGLIVLAGFIMSQQMHTWQTASSLARLSELSNHAAAALQHLQRERGRSASYLGSGGNNFNQELQQQHALTDQHLSALNDYLRSNNIQEFGQDFADTWQTLLDGLALLPQQRSQILSVQIPASQAIDFYSQLNAKLLNASKTLSKIESNREISNMANAYSQALYASENAGTERAILSATLSAKELSFSSMRTLLSLMAQQGMHTKQLLEHTSTVQRNFIEQQLSLPVFTQLEQMREQAIENAAVDIFITDTTDWFTAATGKIDQLHDIAGYLSKELGISTEKSQQQAQQQFIFTLAICAAIFLSAGLFSY